MPFFVNPAKKRRAKPARRRATTAAKRKKNAAKKRTSRASSRRKAASAAKRNPARRKPVAKKRRRPAAKRRKTSSAASRRAKKAAATRKRNALARSRRAKKAAATRKRRRKPAKRRASARRPRRNASKRTVRRRVTRARKNPARKRRRRATTRRASARRNPTRRRRRVSRRRRAAARRPRRNSYVRMRKNPAGIVDAIKAAVPFAASLYGSRFITHKLAPMIPGVDSLGAAAKPVVAGGVMFLAHLGTKKGPKILQKHRQAIMIGSALNVVDAALGAFAPDSIKAMFGIGGETQATMPAATEGYFEVGDYFGVDGAPPLDDQLALSDYVGVGELESEMGMLESELGAEEELGMLEQDLGATDFANRRLGGTHRGQMLRTVPSASMVAPVPARSFTKAVPEVGSGFDNPRGLYTGIFGGGW